MHIRRFNQVLRTIEDPVQANALECKRLQNEKGELNAQLVYDVKKPIGLETSRRIRARLQEIETRLNIISPKPELLAQVA